MEQLFIDLEKMDSISRKENYIHIITPDGDKIIKISDFVKEITNNEFITALSDGRIGFISENVNKGLRNANPRMKCLGNHLTSEQAVAIASETFKDMFVGDFWTINGINWRIGHINYWKNCGDTPCTKPHLLIVPDTPLYNAQMHKTSSGQYESGAANTTTGGYVGSDMYKTGLAQAKAIITEAFGAEHILSHRELLTNAVTNGKPSGHAWYDSTVELMNECMVYGSYIFTPACDGKTISYRYTIDKSQIALFVMCPELICNRANCWLRDVVDDAYFADVSSHGLADCHPRILRSWRAPRLRYLLIFNLHPLWVEKVRKEKMSVPKGKRKESRFEAQHHFYKLRSEVTNLMLLDFGFSEEKYQKSIDRYHKMHIHTENVDEVVKRYQKKCDSFKTWFIDRECDAVLEILRQIGYEFTLGNSIYPSETPAKIMEFCERRKHIDKAIAQCYALKQELQYIICTLPVDINKYERLAVEIDKQIILYKGVRQSDNKFLKQKPNKVKRQEAEPDK